MTAFFLVVLAIAWVAIFFPAVMRARQEAPHTSAERFRRGMELIAPPSSGRRGRWVVVPQSYDRLARSSYARGQRRRLRIFVGLVAAAGLSFVLAVIAGGSVWEVNIAFDLSLASYVALLLETQRRRLERSQKVRSLDMRRRSIERPAETERAFGTR
jgi:Flp pilus assembly protein TadB